jgi:hypothetical protein
VHEGMKGMIMRKFDFEGRCDEDLGRALVGGALCSHFCGE